MRGSVFLTHPVVRVVDNITQLEWKTILHSQSGRQYYIVRVVDNNTQLGQQTILHSYIGRQHYIVRLIDNIILLEWQTGQARQTKYCSYSSYLPYSDNNYSSGIAPSCYIISNTTRSGLLSTIITLTQPTTDFRGEVKRQQERGQKEARGTKMLGRKKYSTGILVKLV